MERATTAIPAKVIEKIEPAESFELSELLDSVGLPGFAELEESPESPELPGSVESGVDELPELSAPVETGPGIVFEPSWNGTMVLVVELRVAWAMPICLFCKS